MRDGVRAYRLDDYRTAEQRFLEALAHFRSIDHATGETDALINLADTALARSETDHARLYLREARSLDGGSRPRLDLIAARIALTEGNHRRVRALTDNLLAGRGDNIRHAALVVRAKSAMASPDEPAEPWLTRLEAVANDGERPLLQASWLRLYARTVTSREAQHAALERALAIYREARYRPGIAAARAALGDLAADSGDRPAAWRHYRRALLIRLWLADRHRASDLIERMLVIAADVNKGPDAEVLRDWRDYLAGGEINWDRLREQSSGL